jgi:hypothetical protein
VLLDTRLTPVATGAEALGKVWRYRVGPADRDVADATTVALEAFASSDALLPLAPVRPKARRTGEGIVLSWIGRGRVGADGWEQVEIPPDGAFDGYEVDILSDAGPQARTVRTLKSGTDQALYPAAAELADFGAAQVALAVRIAALSTAVGRGAALQAQVSL